MTTETIKTLEETVRFLSAVDTTTDKGRSVVITATQHLDNGQWGDDKYAHKFYADEKRMGTFFNHALALVGVTGPKELRFVFHAAPAKDRGVTRRVLWIGRVTDAPPADLPAAKEGLKPAPAVKDKVEQELGDLFPPDAKVSKERPPQVPGDSHGYAGREQVAPMDRVDGVHMGAVAHDAAVVLAAWIAKTGRCPDQAEEEAILAAFRSIRDAMYPM